MRSKNKGNIDAFKVLKTVVTSFLVFNLAMLFPITSFVFPAYKIKANNKLSLNEIIVINVILFFLVGFISKLALVFYISLFLVLEIFYYLFEKIKLEIKIFDRIIITSIISTVCLLLFLDYANGTLELMKKTISDVYINQYGVSKRDLSLIFGYMRKYKIFLLYAYTGFVGYFTYLVTKKAEYKKWKISYQWVILYIIAFFINRYADFGKVVAINTMVAVKTAYALYGVKLIYNLIDSKINNSMISQVIALTVGFYFSSITFIVGALECFDFVKIHIIKLNNGGKR